MPHAPYPKEFLGSKEICGHPWCRHEVCNSHHYYVLRVYFGDQRDTPLPWNARRVYEDPTTTGFRCQDDALLCHLIGIPTTKYLVFDPRTPVLWQPFEPHLRYIWCSNGPMILKAVDTPFKNCLDLAHFVRLVYKNMEGLKTYGTPPEIPSDANSYDGFLRGVGESDTESEGDVDDSAHLGTQAAASNMAEDDSSESGNSKNASNPMEGVDASGDASDDASESNESEDEMEVVDTNDDGSAHLTSDTDSEAEKDGAGGVAEIIDLTGDSSSDEEDREMGEVLDLTVGKYDGDSEDPNFIDLTRD